MMDLGRVDYSSATPPAGYRCGTCGRGGCKLWRGAGGAPEGLWCCDCAADGQGEDVSDIDHEGKYTCPHLGVRVDQIGWRVPAVPDEDGTNFWQYTTIPRAGVEWWHRLPTRPFVGEIAS